MSLRHAVLGLLAVQPSTGYDLARTFDRSLSNAWHAGHSQIYPELSRLEDEGMVEVLSEGARRSRTYGITDGGHEELRRWLVDVPPSRLQRSESAVRMFLSPRLLEPADARVALQRDLDDAVAQRAVLEEIDGQMRETGQEHPFHPAVDLGLRFNEVVQQWLREQLATLSATSGSGRRP